MRKEEKSRNRETPKRVLSRLQLHSHEQPLLAGHVQAVGPVVQGSELKPNPLQALHEALGVALANAAIDADDEVLAVQGTVAQFDKGHESLLQIGADDVVVEEDKERLLPQVIGDEGVEAGAAGKVPELQPGGDRGPGGYDGGGAGVAGAVVAEAMAELRVFWRRRRQHVV